MKVLVRAAGVIAIPHAARSGVFKKAIFVFGRFLPSYVSILDAGLCRVIARLARVPIFRELKYCQFSPDFEGGVGLLLAQFLLLR